MTNDQRMPKAQCPSSWRRWVLVVCVIAIAGCSSPNAVNIQLRKDKQQLEEQVAKLGQEVQAARARIQSFESQGGTLPTLPQERLDRMFTVHGIRLGRLSGGWPGDAVDGPDQGLKIYLSPVDETDEAIKASGTVEIEAFDLDLQGENRVGKWTFDPIALKSRWRSLAMLRAFVLECPWEKQKAPQHSKLAVKVSFRDELSGRVYSEIKEVQVRPPATQATTRTAGR